MEQTLPQLLAKRAIEEEHTVALREKNLGVWNEITWGEYYEIVKQFAIALSVKCNFKRGEKLAIIGDNRPQWLFSQLAAQFLGGISVGVYQESSPKQLIYYLNDSQASVVVVEGQEQVDKLLEIEEKIPLVKQIIFYNNQGMRHYDHPKLYNFHDLIEIGSSLLNEKDDFLFSKTERLLSDDVAVISYSSATTGKPKAVMLSHSNLIAAAENLGDVDKMEKKDDYLSFLPLAWIYEQVMSIAMPLTRGMVINFPEKSSTILADLREIGPHTLIAPPRVYKSIHSNFMLRIQETSWFKKKVYQTFKKFGDKVAEMKLNKKPISGGVKFIYLLGNFLVFSAIRDHLGLARIKRAYVAGSPLSSELFHFFHSIGVNVKQSYGGTELAGIAFVHRDDDIRVENAGLPLPNTEVKVGEDGEIFVKSPSVFLRYLHEDTKHDDGGWISLGDYGRIDDNGHLHILDHKEAIMKGTNGETISPTIVENKLKVSPYIQEAVCFGKNKPYMSAILNIDMNSVGRWAEKNQITYTTYSELSRKPEVIQLIEKEVAKLMKQLPQQSRVKKFVLLHKQLNANDEEMTRTLKVRRQYISEKYRTLIEGLYTDTQEVKVTDKVEAADGKESIIETNLRVIQLEAVQEVA
ncbi:long-chain fatty acid--CoA ligase [Pueribacillus theae]|uniref:Acyl-CoA synthetase n=1 Tax=Pueribacillus theae TaxID=2171751 RepID=A0A2U1K2G5_9BACI|nr:long-chain fatty acid--CoA ligase [Pueribacillus theae]